jgi:asparagine synthase (glutamine-hydrolysing)
MCGVAGILNLDGRPVEADEVGAITRALARRGPDGEGLYLDGPLGLGHRRLAILDLSDAGKQPMPCVAGRYWITYNGEVYNFVELRKELETLGHRFASDTDTEVIGCAYDQWGPDCVLKFNGMWAFAVWDARRRELFLSCDRFSIKPLHYLREPGRFVFASELKAFLHLRGFTPREDEEAMRRCLVDIRATTGWDDSTLLRGVKRLRGGHNMLVSAAGTKVWRWWRTLDHIETPPRTLAGQAERFRELFFDACRLRLRSDVPVATCLSGGLDSTAVLCTLAALRGEDAAAAGRERRCRDSHRAFVATFPGTARDERRYAEVAVRHAGAEPHYLPVTPELALASVQQFAYDFENINSNFPMPQWAIYRELRRGGVVVSLDGHGADEMLAGYMNHINRALRARGSWLRAPRRTLDLVRTVHAMYGDSARPPGLVQLAADGDPFLRLARRALRGVWTRARRAAARRGPAAEEPWVRGSPEVRRFPDPDEEAAVAALGALDGELYRDFHDTNLPGVLRNFDRTSMAHGVETRMPFMDWRLVCFVFGLPEESKAGGGLSKRVLREAMRGVMPEELRTRKGKIGFQSPMVDWFNGVMRDWVWEQVQSRSFLDTDTWDGRAIRDFVAARRGKAWTGADCNRVWRFLHAHRWRQDFLQGQGSGGLDRAPVSDGCPARREPAAGALV